MATCSRCGGSGMEPDWRAFGRLVRRERERMGWSLRELARRADCSPAFVSDMEHGRRGGGLGGGKTWRILTLLGLAPCRMIDAALARTEDAMGLGRNRKRSAESFERNFHSQAFVDFTRASPCLFCGSRDRVRTAHVVEGRKLGGRGGDWRDAGPVCFGCDDAWSRGRRTFLDQRGLDMDEVRRRVAAHVARFEARGSTNF